MNLEPGTELPNLAWQPAISPLSWASWGENKLNETGSLEQITESRERAGQLFKKLEEVRGFLWPGQQIPGIRKDKFSAGQPWELEWPEKIPGPAAEKKATGKRLSIL